ncbi:MAG: EamA family transporter [Clostridia bacterium]|nr:EamA family transporter [Clostridia bacterium]
MFISAMLIFGTIGVFRRSIPLPSAFLACARGILGGLFVLAYALIRKKPAVTALPRRDVIRLAVTGAVIGVNWILLFEAYNYTTVAVATLCYYMQPVIVLLVSPLVFRERLTPGKMICAGLAVIGMVLISGVTGGEDLPETNLRGILLGLGAAACYSVVVIMNKKTVGIDTYPKTVIQLLAAGLAMVPYILLTGGEIGTFTPKTAGLLLVIGLVHTGLAYVLYFGSIGGLKVQSIALLSYIDPVSALLFSAWLLGEKLSLAGIAGALLIIGSAAVSERLNNKNS